MTECQTCNATLVTDGLNPGQQIRCANCLAFSRFGKIEKIAADRLAWRSLWLGLASIVFLTLTGIPAMIYGIRSLLRMRFVKPKRGDQAAAVAGTALGGCFGIFIGFVAMCAAAIAAVSALTSSETESPEDIAKLCDEFFQFEASQFMPVRASSSLNRKSFDFADQRQTADRAQRLRLAFLQHSIQPNDAVMYVLLNAKQVNDQDLGAAQETDQLQWEMNGHPLDVRRTRFLRTNDSQTEADSQRAVPAENPDDSLEQQDSQSGEWSHQYLGYQSYTDGIYGISIVFEPARCELTEQQVEQIFASIRLPRTTGKPKSLVQTRRNMEIKTSFD